VLDTVAHNRRHAEAMQKNPEMQHNDPNGRQLNSKTSRELLWHFTKPGTFEYACLRPGHYEAGMKGVVLVANEPSRGRKNTKGTKKNTERTPLLAGEVTKVDKSAGTITIKHGPIAKFDMDGMTMEFRAKHPAMLKQVKPGDKIKFDVDKINGRFTVTKIEKGK
jgi:Cu/Ag efflux protein CusF